MCLSFGVLTGHYGREWTTDALYVSSAEDSILTHFKIEINIQQNVTFSNEYIIWQVIKLSIYFFFIKVIPWCLDIGSLYFRHSLNKILIYSVITI